MGKVYHILKEISREIDKTFEELIELLIRKSISPISKNIRAYTYIPLSLSLGRHVTLLVVLRMVPKMGRPLLWSDNPPAIVLEDLSWAIAQRIPRTFLVEIHQDQAHEKLAIIGEEILEQTEPGISEKESARMSTANLRLALFRLENTLKELYLKYPEIYHDYLSMVSMINSIEVEKMSHFLEMIATGSPPVLENPLYQWLISRDPSMITRLALLHPLLRMLAYVFKEPTFGKMYPNIYHLSTNKIPSG
jgi:hypothetical protein